MTRFVECHMCRRLVPESRTHRDPDGDRMCRRDWRCTAIAMTRLGIESHRAEREAKRLYEVES